jgi:recombination protein RecA
LKSLALDNAREFLRENEALAFEIENKVRESLGIPLLAGGVDTPAAKEEKAPKASKAAKEAKGAADADADGVVA